MSNYNDYNNNYYNNPFVNSNMNNQKEKKSYYKMILLFIFLVSLIIVGYILISNKSNSYLVKFEFNGVDNIENKEMRCQSDSKGHCFLTLPNAKRSDGEVLGYSKNKNARDAEYQTGEEIEVFENITLFAISRKKYNLIIDRSDIDVLEDGTFCYAYNQEQSCKLSIPMFNKLGYQINGYSLKKGDRSNIVSFGTEYELQSDLNLYPVYSEYEHGWEDKKIHFNIERSVYIYNTYLDVGIDCDNDGVNELVDNLKKLYEYFPFYAYYSKIILLSDREYLKYVSMDVSLSGGLTFEDNLDNPTVIVRYDDYPFPMERYLSTVHELSHAFDLRAKGKTGNYINTNNDVRNLRNKYYSMNNRPLQEGAYSDDDKEGIIVEFFAELMTYYYINYLDTSYTVNPYFTENGAYNRGNFPDDMKMVAEKYICFGKNNFDMSKCS